MLPEIATVAWGEVATATTTTLVVPTGTETIPSIGIDPPTVREVKLVSVEIGRTFKVTVYVLTAPLAAVTTAVNVLFPSIKPDLPETTTTDSASSGVATTVTTRVNGGRAIVPLSVAVRPLTVKVERLVFVLNGATTALMVTTLIVFKSGAVTVTTTSLEPTTRPVRPVIFTLAAGSRVIATTFTDVVRERS